MKALLPYHFKTVKKIESKKSISYNAFKKTDLSDIRLCTTQKNS